MATLLLIDDEPDVVVTCIQQGLRHLIKRIEVARTGAEGLRLAETTRPNVILLDLNLPDMKGLDVLDELRARDARCPVIMITASNTTDTAIDAMKRGAYEYLIKNPSIDQLESALRQALEVNRCMTVPAVVGDAVPADANADAMIGRCPAMIEVYKAIGRVADQDVTVLITGASGTGKELVARAIYQHSRRKAGPFLAINCAAIPEPLLESELFGHEKGAFTGAHRRRIGKFEQCSGGTLFLDEIGDMTPLTQSKMLRLLQDQQFERVGGNETIRTDVRVLAATNRNLSAMAAEGRFRLDLFYRLSVFTIHLPPLQERPGDMPWLVDHYLRRYNRELGKQIKEATPEALALLQGYSWPGNVRELQSVLKQAMLRAQGSFLLPDFLPAQVHGQPRPGYQAAQPATAGGELESFIRTRLAAGSRDLYTEVVQRVERQLLPLVLAHTHGSQVQAAQVLGITRRTLRNRLRELGLTITQSVETGEDEVE